MTLTFKNPPLAEIIAELRWLPTQMLDPARGIPMLVFEQTAAPYEEAFVKFVAKMSPLGFENVERVTPSGMPMFPYQAVMRLKPKIGSNDPTVYQIGPNYFSANATQPYKSWSEFQGKVRQGVTALLEVRPQKDNTAPVLASLRYIDAFRENLTGGVPPSEFLSSALGVQVHLPDAITRHCAPGQQIKANIRLTVPLSFGTMSIALFEGTVKKTAAFVMDTTVAHSTEIAPDVDAVMTAFSTARDVIHDVFVRMTNKLSSKMEPQGADE